MLRAAFFLLTCGCGSSEDREGRSPPPEPESAAPATARFEGVGRFLPHPTLGAWRQSGEVRYFDGGNLFNYMNGASDGYLEYGVVALATTEYVPEATVGGSPRTVTVEVFDMGSAEGAFGKWSRIAGEQGDPVQVAARFVAIGAGGLQGGADLTFWKGQHLVKLTYLDEDPNATEEGMRSASRDVLGAMARTIADGLPGGTDPPAEIRRFPADGLIAHSPVHFKRAVLGREGMGPGWRAWYERGGKRIMLVRAGRAAWDALRVGATASPSAAVGEESCALRDDLLGDVVLARKGDVVVFAADPDLPDLPRAPAAAKSELVRQALDL
jgi:hypothetical protein